MLGWRKKLVTVALYIVAGILITWAIWLGPAPRGGRADATLDAGASAECRERADPR